MQSEKHCLKSDAVCSLSNLSGLCGTAAFIVMLNYTQMNICRQFVAFILLSGIRVRGTDFKSTFPNLSGFLEGIYNFFKNNFSCTSQLCVTLCSYDGISCRIDKNKSGWMEIFVSVSSAKDNPLMTLPSCRIVWNSSQYRMMNFHSCVISFQSTQSCSIFICVSIFAIRTHTGNDLVLLLCCNCWDYREAPSPETLDLECWPRPLWQDSHCPKREKNVHHYSPSLLAGLL